MKEEYFRIGEMPVLLLGEPSPQVILFVHGQGGSKEEARRFAETACPLGWQVLGVDLPAHGERVSESAAFVPWNAVPELQAVEQYARVHWRRLALRANSIGCWFSLLAFSEKPLAQCLFVSPLVDMERMIANLMNWSCVDEARLEREGQISTSFGQTLSWEYLTYVRLHPVHSWRWQTSILRAAGDEQIDGDTVEAFRDKFHCLMTVTEGGEHWFHTPEELAVLRNWEETELHRL